MIHAGHVVNHGGVYGIPLTYRHLKDESCFDLFKGVTNYFLNRLPKIMFLIGI